MLIAGVEFDVDVARRWTMPTTSQGGMAAVISGQPSPLGPHNETRRIVLRSARPDPES